MPQKGQTSGNRATGNRAAPARAAATATTLVGLVALAGWAFHIPTLTRVLPGAVEMKANTAVALVLCGVALLILADRAAVSMARIALGAALAAVAVGLATLAEYAFGWQLGIDELLVNDTDVAYNVFRGRMSPLSAAAFVVIGSALTAMRRDSLLNAAKSAAGLVILIGAVCIVGYLWNAGELITDTWLPPVAINTAICFVLLGAGILLSPGRSGAGLDMELSDLATVEIKILAGFLLAVSLPLFGGAYTYRTSVELAESVEWVAHTQEVRATLGNLHGSLAGAELAQRDYLLTAQRVRLDEYVRLVKTVQDHLTELGRLISDNPAQHRDWAALKSAVQIRLDDMAGAVAAYQTYGLPAARAVIGQGGLNHATEDARVIAERMDAVEVRLLAERRAAAENVRRTTLISLLVTLALASAILIVLFRGIRREMRARRDAERALRDKFAEVKRAETNLTAANRFLDSLIESLPVMIFVKDARTLCYVRQNRATLNLLGLSRDDVIGKRDRDFLPAEQADAILATDREVLAAGRLVDIPEQSIHTRLLGVRTLHTMKMPILDEHGTPEFLLGISEDITERKLAEHAIRELNAALLAKAAQLEATNKELESFSYSVSHDLRAPLRAIDGFALMLMEDYAERLDAEGLRYLSVVRQNSRRMGALIDDLLTFSRLGRQAVAHAEVNVDSLVREVVEEVLHAESLGGRRDAATAPHIEVEPLPPARGDRGLLRQVWANLIANAVKYSSKAARPSIQVSGRQVGAESHYSVRDNGVGFSMEYAGQLFRVFQRLHRADEFGGTGVGLAIVHRVVTRHGGRVWAEGKVDHGAVFSFALPRGDQSG
jgi:PAS domain S-box-containing protein